MNNKIVDNNAKEYYTIDLLHVMKSLWRRAWLIALSGFLAAVLGFCISAFAITPTYSSSVMLYVNNTSFSLGNVSISASQITAAQSLVKTYSEILKSRTTLERVIDKTGVSYTYQELYGMIKAVPSNETEIMKVTVTTTDPYEAAKIANGIAEVLPVRVSEIIDGTSMEVVDSAIPNLSKVAPSITKYTALGLILGVLLAAAILAILAIMDDTIHDEDYILQNYDCPILAKVPNLLNSGTKHYGYYYQSKRKAQE
jgi:capsular polysaccharide biosynthesis protein